jgi:pantoate--beta-alanine ligase
MQVIKTIKDMQALSRGLKVEKKTIGFVPTMGALHEGHLSLVRRSKKENDITVVSIFVNPIQFGPKEDFKQYPRDLEGDLKKLDALNTDIVFVPDEKEMYPQGFSTVINVGAIGEILCGVTRKGHFNGVATVVAKLFNIVMPQRAYFGQKDFQQSVIIKKLVRELNFDIDIIVCPIVREPDGLAMSSRNSYLNQDERKAAIILYKALRHGEELINKGVKDVSYLKEEIRSVLSSEPLAKIEYVEIVDPESLEDIKEMKTQGVICIAVRIGTTRLIDNLIVSAPS